MPLSELIEAINMATDAKIIISVQIAVKKLFSIKQLIYRALDQLIIDKRIIDKADEHFHILTESFTEIELRACQLAQILFENQCVYSGTMPRVSPDIRIPMKSLTYPKIIAPRYTESQLFQLWQTMMSLLNMTESPRLAKSFELHQRILELLLTDLGTSLIHQLVLSLTHRLESIGVTENKSVSSTTITHQCAGTQESYHYVTSPFCYQLTMNSYTTRQSLFSAIIAQGSQQSFYTGWLPPIIELAHELIHLLHILQGSFDKSQLASASAAAIWTNLEEVTTIRGPGMCENDFREVFGLNKRVGHCGMVLTSCATQLSALTPSKIDTFRQVGMISPRHTDPTNALGAGARTPNQTKRKLPMLPNIPKPPA